METYLDSYPCFLRQALEAARYAVAAGLDRTAEVVSTGSDAPGTVLQTCSAEFRRRYEKAQMIVVKGQANYETLSGEGDRLFFLFKPSAR